jgi:hypothetical protein
MSLPAACFTAGGFALGGGGPASARLQPGNHAWATHQRINASTREAPRVVAAWRGVAHAASLRLVAVACCTAARTGPGSGTADATELPPQHRH